ncbi:SDR family oxidoreductase [Actinoplanes sp. NPDC051859]|uniref:SDR family oxidoreductase n=1 Tax=Actinoplanes sp. NPDC051859 TaxID=3363909 RepID=UPI00379C4FD1
MHPLDASGRRVVVTGGTRGIGAAIARAFLNAGARVLVCGRTEPGSAVADFFRADVRDPEQAAALIAAAVKQLGGIDVLINNAGGAPPVSANTASPRLHAKVIELNLLAPLHVSQAAYPVLRDQPGGGHIIMIGSMSGARPSPGTAAYGAAKAGLHHLAGSLAMEWAPKIRVNTLVVGPVDTETHGPQVDPQAVARTVPMGRAAMPAEIADACLLLASPLAGYVSGAELAVHGGGEWPGYLADPRTEAYPPQK